MEKMQKLFPISFGIKDNYQRCLLCYYSCRSQEDSLKTTVMREGLCKRGSHQFDTTKFEMPLLLISLCMET